jgi:hypothetical protein
VAFGREEQPGMAMRFPKLAQELQGAFRQRDVAVIVAFAAADVQEHPFGIDVADLQAQTLAQAQAARVEGDEGDAMIQGRDRRQDPTHLGGREDDREFDLGVGADQFDLAGPDAMKGFFPEHLDRAQRLGAGLAGDLLVGLEMDEVLANFLDGDEFGRTAVELTKVPDAGQVGLDGPRADGQEGRSSVKDLRMACGELFLYA